MNAENRGSDGDVSSMRVYCLVVCVVCLKSVKETTMGIKIKIALTASYYDRPKVKELLQECDVIYTTQIQNAESLRSMFRDVRFIPDSTPSMLEFLKSLHAGAEFIEFPRVFELAHQS